MGLNKKKKKSNSRTAIKYIKSSLAESNRIDLCMFVYALRNDDDYHIGFILVAKI